MLLEAVLFIGLSSGTAVDSADATIDTASITRADIKEELLKTWTQFANAVIADDSRKIIKLSTECIRCTDCILREEEDDSTLKKKYDNLFYYKSYKKSSYLSIWQFLKRDRFMVFDGTTKLRLLDSLKYSMRRDKQDKELFNKTCFINPALLNDAMWFDVIVTVVDSSDVDVGFKKVFLFMKMESGFKFCGYSTIP